MRGPFEAATTVATLLGTALVVGLLLGAAPLAAQHGDEAASPASEEFLTRAAVAAERYADRREAIADGFRRIGPDFPGMGVHWVHTSRILAGTLEGDRPPVLCYVELDGEPTLVGLAYTLPLAGDESPPEEPFGTEVWHDHSGEVAEESLLLNHPSSMTASEPSFRLAMVHVWLPLDNPAGPLVQNNWTIPYLRAGLEPPEEPGSIPARGLSLGSGGVGYYRELLYWATPADSRERDLMNSMLERRGAEVDAWVERHDGDWTDEDLATLERFWNGLWDDLEEALAEETYGRIEPLRAGH